MSKFDRLQTQFFNDHQYPPKFETAAQILERLGKCGFDTFEIIPSEIDEKHKPSATFANNLPPSWRRKSKYGSDILCYALEDGFDPAALAAFVYTHQEKFACRLSRASPTGARRVSIKELLTASECAEMAFPGFKAPQRIDGEMLIHDLDVAVTLTIIGGIQYFTEGGELVDHVIHEMFDTFELENAVVFGDLATYETPIGFSIRTVGRGSVFPIDPSFTVHATDDERWNVYLIDDAADKIAEVHKKLQDICADRRGVLVETRFPLPVARYRLARTSAEKVEFEEDFAVYSAEPFLTLARSTAR
ncbi:hypothetical protein F4695_004563 [Rhizobium soli]|uniref:Uncharacterized protein n=1 Tax=Rhizobium soli TaxID=424798 RepID=A0A7X0JP11_9HYPH|nr:hypothetical protein [Rhizobium soli]MBB6511165.1 hypothetical protein [Rhizobium soli]